LGESTALAHAVFIIVSVMMASMLAIFVFAKLGYLESVFSQSIQDKSAAVGIRLLIISAYNNTDNGTIDIFVKNIGTLPFNDLERMDVYIGNYTEALDYYTYSQNLTPGHYNYVEYSESDNVWSPGETIKIVVSPVKSYDDLIRVKIVLPNGASAEEVVELLPG